MKYYKIDIKSHFPELGRIASGAEGKNVPEKEYFYRIGKREIIENTPIFDLIKKNTGNGLYLMSTIL